MPRFWYTCLKILMKHFKTLMWSVQILRCLLREFCLVVWLIFFYFSECLAHCNPQTCGLSLSYWKSVTCVLNDYILASNFGNTFVTRIRFTHLYAKNGFELAKCQDWPSSRFSLEFAYCSSIDAWHCMCCALLILLK